LALASGTAPARKWQRARAGMAREMVPQDRHNWEKIFHSKRRHHQGSIIVVYGAQRKPEDCCARRPCPTKNMSPVKSNIHIRYIIHGTESCNLVQQEIGSGRANDETSADVQCHASSCSSHLTNVRQMYFWPIISEKGICS